MRENQTDLLTEMVDPGRCCFIEFSFFSGLYHDAVIATNLALQLSPNLVVSLLLLIYTIFC